MENNNRKRVLVTGGAGFIGSHLVKYALNQGHEVYALDQHWSLDHELKSDYWNSKLHRYTINIATQTTDLESIFDKVKPDITFALHAYASEGRSNHIRSFIHSNNTVSMANVINACVNHKCKLIFTSSIAVMSGIPPFNETMTPNPVDSYGVSKYCSELDIQIAGQLQNLDWCIIRPRNVYGEGQSLFDPSRNLMGILCYRALNNIPIAIYGDGLQRRSFTYIDDLIPPLYNAKDVNGEIINLGSPFSWSVKDAVACFSKISGYKNIVHTEPRHEVKEAFCEIDKSVRLLKYQHRTSLETGLTKMWAWAQTVKMRPLDEPPKLEVEVNAHSSLKP